ncbi:hypothetical protein NPIL_548281 [Nephila pilipes]|uniref:Uncharacterized protein n=1 Tax=Nephila pilipes TaxID=299642 RepID=A0A8X6PQW3_NEPPI|nr:hypothetical protein NPIL_548281 [Nephila pilipes]
MGNWETSIIRNEKNNKSEEKSLCEIGEVIQRSHCMVKKIIDKYTKSQPVKYFHKTGRRPNDTEVRNIEREVNSNPTPSASKILQIILQTSEKMVRANTTRTVNEHEIIW